MASSQKSISNSSVIPDRLTDDEIARASSQLRVTEDQSTANDGVLLCVSQLALTANGTPTDRPHNLPLHVDNFFLSKDDVVGELNEKEISASLATSFSSSDDGEVTFPNGEARHHKGDDECGWLCFRPRFLQATRTANWVLFCMCWVGAVQGMVVNGFVNVCITTIEKRYHLRSADTGSIAVAYDIASVLFSVPVSYFGSKAGASKPRWIGMGLLVMGLGSFVFATPHFAVPSYSNTVSGTTEQVLHCLINKSVSASCAAATEAWLSSFWYVFVLGQVLHGLGAVPLYTLGITFLDESVPVRNSSLYLGVFYAMAIVGPALGYLIGAQMLNVYIDVFAIGANNNMTVGSGQWLGAWWLGFLLAGLLAVLGGIAVMAFPREIPGSEIRASQRVCEANLPSATAVGTSSIAMTGFYDATRSLARNRTFLCLSMAGATEGVLLTGFATFMPKFMESQFSLSASDAALLVGLIAVPAGGGGTLIGGYVIKRFSLKCAAILRLCLILSAICFFSYFSFVISCPDSEFAGITVPYPNSSLGGSNVSASCNANCGCSDVPYSPVCGGGITYFSACHAGCRRKHTQDDITATNFFSDCSCMKSDNDLAGEGSIAHLKKCSAPCSLMSMFLVIFFIIMTITFVLSLPAVSGTLRCVPDSYRSLALGLQWIVIRVLGTIPGPILFGFVIDGTCRFWQQTCGVVGACRNYDNLRMSRSMMAISLFFKCLSTVFFGLAWWFYVPPRQSHSANAVALDDTVTSSVSSIESSTPNSNPMAKDNPVFEHSP